MFSALDHESLADFLTNHIGLIIFWGWLFATFVGYLANKIKGNC